MIQKNTNTDDKYTNGWNEWSKHVLLELERLNDHLTEVERKIDNVKYAVESDIHKLNLDLATLKTKFGMIGVVIGGSFVIVAEIFMWLVDKFIK